jgi:hypothetical protein
MISRRRYRCRFCSALLPAWFPVAKRPNSAMLLYHLGQDHIKEARPYLRRMETESINRVLAELFEGSRGKTTASDTPILLSVTEKWFRNRKRGV